VGESEIVKASNRHSTLITLTQVAVLTLKSQQVQLIIQIAPEIRELFESQVTKKNETPVNPVFPLDSSDLDVEKVLQRVLAKKKAGKRSVRTGEIIHRRVQMSEGESGKLFSRSNSNFPNELREETALSSLAGEAEKFGGTEPGSFQSPDETDPRIALHQTLDEDMSMYYPTPSINSGAVQRPLSSPIHSLHFTINKSIGNPIEGEQETADERDRDQTISAAQRALALAAVEEDQERSNTKSIIEHEREIAKLREIELEFEKEDITKTNKKNFHQPLLSLVDHSDLNQASFPHVEHSPSLSESSLAGG
jgi:hypothetical protein